MKIKHQLSIATLILAGVFATGCSQQSAGGSQMAGGSQSQIEGGSQMAGGSQQASSQQQVEEKEVMPPVVTPRPEPKPIPPVAGNCHTHPANQWTKTIRHCHPNPTGKHRYGGQRRAPVSHGNRWTHTHPAIPHCTKSIRHTHKYTNRNHHHRYQCTQGARTMAPQPHKVDVYALQRKLKAKGYYKGPIDGVVGPATRGALKRFMNR